MKTPYENLANAIIIQAAKDYKSVVHQLKKTPVPEPNALKSEKKAYEQLLTKKSEILRFFHSAWYMTLTNVDPQIIIRNIEKEVG